MNGKIESETDYLNNLKNGKYISYHTDGTMIQKGYYKDDYKDGNWLVYLGVLEENWEYPLQMKQYNHITYMKGLILKIEENYVKGTKHGTWFSYYENGQLKDVVNYDNGLLSGERIIHYEDGQVSYKGNYVNDNLDGKVFYYYEDGKLRGEVNFKDGKLIETKDY